MVTLRDSMAATASQTQTIKRLAFAIAAVWFLSLLIPESAVEDDVARPLLDAQADAITAFVEERGGTQRTLVRRADRWIQMKPWSAAADDEAVHKHLSALTDIALSRTVEVTELNFDRRVVIEDSDGTQQDIRIGRRAPGSDGNYIQIGNQIWLTDTQVPPALTDDEVIDKRVLSFKRHQAKHLVVGAVELEQTSAGWRVRANSQWAMANQSDVRSLLDALLDLRVETFATQPVNGTEMSVRVSDKDHQTLAAAQVRRGAEWTAQIHEGRWAAITPGLSPWVDHGFSRRAVFDFDPELVNRFEMETRGEAREMNSGGPILTASGLLALEGRIAAPEFTPEPSAGTTITVHLAGSDQVHKAQFWAEGQRIFASHGSGYAAIELETDSAEHIKALAGSSSL